VSEFAPDHFVDNAGVGLYEFDDFGGNALIGVVGNGEAEVVVAVHLDSNINCLEK